MRNDMITPCYVIASNGMRETVAYKDDWCYGKSRFIGAERGTDSGDTYIRNLIKADIRQAPAERNGLPIYFVSDHGNIHRRRAIRLRKI